MLIPDNAKICHYCQQGQKWYTNFRINDLLLFASILLSFCMVLLSYWNFHEAKEERIKAADALKIANTAASKAADAVIRANTSANMVSKAEKSVTGTVERMKKIEQSSVDVNDKVKQIQVKTSHGFEVFESNLKDMKEETDIISLSYEVKSGDKDALNQLIELTRNDKNQKGKFAKSLLNDANLYFKDYKYNLVQLQIINSKTKQPIRPAAEVIYDGIYKNQDVGMREAYINEIAVRGFKYFVQDLIKIVRDDPNLKIACRAENTIEKLTGERFEDYPPYNKVQSWWEQTGKTDAKYSNSINRLNEIPVTFGEKESNHVLSLLKEIINSQKGMCSSHTMMGEIYLANHDKDKAKEHFKIAIEECDGQIQAALHCAEILYSEGKKSEVIDILSKSVPHIEDIDAFEKQCRSSFPDIVNEDGFKNIFKHNNI